MALLDEYIFEKMKKLIIRFLLSLVILPNPLFLEPFGKNIHQEDSYSAKGKDRELKRYKKIEALENYNISSWVVQNRK